MKLQIQPNRWSCLPTSFAMVLGMDLVNVIHWVGHDGSQILYPKLSEPAQRRSFHIQELIDLAWERRWCVTPFEPNPIANHDSEGLHHHRIEFPQGNNARMLNLLKTNSGVFTGLTEHGSPHAVAWDSLEGRIFNPSGKDTPLDSFAIQTFWVMTRI